MKTLKIKSITTHHKFLAEIPEETHSNCIAYVPAKLTGENGQMRATVSIAKDKASAGNNEWLACFDFWMDATENDADVLDVFKRRAAAGELPEVKELAL